MSEIFVRLLRMRERFANVLIFIIEHRLVTRTALGFSFKMATPEATVPEATLTKFKDELTCSLCNELFREPKTLSCLHTFCEECLSNHITKRVVDTDPQAGDSREKVPCPLCQNVQELPEADVKHVKTNHGYKNMVSHLSIEEGARTACSSESDRAVRECQGCKEKPAAVTFCSTCNQHLCTSCTTAHKTLNIFATHEVLTREEISSSSKEGGQIVTHHTWKCSKHDDLNPDSPLTDVCLYCKTCDELICNRCGIIEPHGNHEKHEAPKIIDKPGYKPKIQQHEAEVKQVQEMFATFITEMESLQKSLEGNREKAKMEINEKVQALHAKLNEEKEALLKKVDQIFERKNERLIKQLQKLREIEKEMAESRKFVNDILTFGIPEEVLFLMTQMITRMKQLHNTYNPYPRIPQENDIVMFKENMALDLTGAIGTVSADPFPPAFTADTLSKTHFIQDEEASITVTCRDIAGTPHPIKHDLKVEMSPEANGDVIRGEVRERNVETGEYIIVLKPLTHGKHELKISVVVGNTDVSIAGSPFPIAVSAPVVHQLQPQNQPIPNMGNPWGVAVNEEGVIVISDIGEDKHMLVVVRPNDFEVIRRIGKKGKGKVEFMSPRGLAFTPDGDIAVAEKENHRVQLVSLEGDYKGKFGREGDGNGEFRGATDIAISSDGKIFVTDSTLNRIQYFTPNGEFIGMFGSWGPLNVPYAITFDVFGRILITERRGNCLDFYKKNVQENGEDIASSSSSDQPAESPQEFARDFKTTATLSEPVGVVFDPVTNYIVVTELGNHRISIFNKNGQHIRSLDAEGNPFTSPMGIATLNDSRFIVCDCTNAKVVIFNIV